MGRGLCGRRILHADDRGETFPAGGPSSGSTRGRASTRPKTGSSGVSATQTVPGLAGTPPVSPAGPSSAPGRVTPPRGSITPLPRLPDLAVAAVHQRYQRYWRAASPSPDIDVLIRNNGGDYAGPMKIHVRSYSTVPVLPGRDPYPETNKTFNYERVEIPGGGQMSLGLERAITGSPTQWGCRRQVIVTLDRKVHNDVNPGNNSMGTTFFEQTGIGSELSPLGEVELKADSNGDWRRIRTDKIHRLRSGMYTVRFRLVSWQLDGSEVLPGYGQGIFSVGHSPGGGRGFCRDPLRDSRQAEEYIAYEMVPAALGRGLEGCANSFQFLLRHQPTKILFALKISPGFLRI